MSEYGFLVCHECRTALDLGKAVKRPDDSVYYYLSGNRERNWEQPDLARSLWKVLADHTGHSLVVIREFSQEYEDWTKDRDANGPYTTVGGDAIADIPFDEYLADWPG